MELKIKVLSNRDENECIDTNDSFLGNIDEMEKYSFRFFVNVFEGNISVAEIHGIVFDEDKCLNEGQDIVDIADMYSGDAEGAISTLIKSEIYNREIDDDLLFTSPFSCYIERVYVNPLYRKKGVGKYIFNNLYEILLHCLNIHIRCFVIYPKPQQTNDNGNWEDSLDVDGSMKKLMVDVIEKSGYRQIGESGYFAINCMLGNGLFS